MRVVMFMLNSTARYELPFLGASAAILAGLLACNTAHSNWDVQSDEIRKVARKDAANEAAKAVVEALESGQQGRKGWCQDTIVFYAEIIYTKADFGKRIASHCQAKPSTLAIILSGHGDEHGRLLVEGEDCIVGGDPGDGSPFLNIKSVISKFGTNTY